ncbi:unnamed protein product [Rotaria sp. Silwood1]|nr:unnamed protein product [Rotaria sp. Silwood1]
MEDKSNITTDNISLNTNVNNDDIHENLSSSNNYIDFLQSNDDDNEKTSELIAEQADALINEGHLTNTHILGLIQTRVLSIPNVDNQNIDNINNNIISEVNSQLASTSVQPCVQSIIQLNVNHTSTDNNQQQIKKKKHIMISYNHASASNIAQKIYDRLTERHYNVWFDKKDLHGSVLDSMGEAVENSYVVLLCMTDGYSKSAFCTKEAKYAVEKKIPVIPCMVEKTFRPSGGLGIIKSDLKHIKLFDEDKFDENFEELIDEINAIEIGLGMKSAAPIMDIDFRDHFNAFISEHIESIRNCHLHRENLTENEFGTILYKLIQAFSPETLESFQNDQSNSVDTRQLETHDNDRLIQHLLENDKKLAELVRIQEEIYARNQQYLLEYDERIAAFIRFQEQTNKNFMQQQINQNEHLSSLIHVQEEQQRNYAYLQQSQLFNQNQQSIQLEYRQQDQEKNDRISQQLIQHIQQLTELIVKQQQQHAKDTESLHQLVNRSLENNNQYFSLLHVQHRQANQFDFNLFTKLIQTIILLCTLLAVLKK